MDEKPYSLVNIRIWRKTRDMLRKLQAHRGGTMVMLLNQIVRQAYEHDGLHTTK